MSRLYNRPTARLGGNNTSEGVQDGGSIDEFIRICEMPTTTGPGRYYAEDSSVNLCASRSGHAPSSVAERKRSGATGVRVELSTHVKEFRNELPGSG